MKLKFLFVTLLILSVGCSKAPEEAPKETPKVQEFTENPVVVMTMDSGDVVRIELYPDVAPMTVTNFVALVEDGFYDGLTFHRIIPGFMVQGGDPDGTGMGGPGHVIKGEFKSNGFENNLKHERGVISMARSQSPDSAGSQFFIMHADYPGLNGDYAAFGKVIENIEAIDRLAAVKTSQGDYPVEKQVIQSMIIE